jgi:hypothetical protein
MNTSSVLLKILLPVGALLLAAPVLSRGGFEATTYRVFKLERVPQSALASANCQVCHVRPQGDAPWNPFGLAVGFWRGKKQTLPDALYSALRYGGDTDRDGYPNTFEALAGTKPDDRDDKPTATLEALRTQFDAKFSLTADADVDGYADALEVFAGTLPGDATSKPGEARDALEQRFEAAGGLSLFKLTTK